MASSLWTRQNLAFQDLSEFPPELAEKEGAKVEELDLTHNRISDLKFLIDYPRLTTLILDHNNIQSHVKIPHLPALHTLWVNHNRIKNLATFISTVTKNCPNLRLLSMMNNEAAPSYFNGGTFQQYMDYRYYVISKLAKLEVLDDKHIAPDERSEAERLYGRTMAKSKRKNKRKSQTEEEADTQKPSES